VKLKERQTESRGDSKQTKREQQDDARIRKKRGEQPKRPKKGKMEVEGR
jgi:hypothetical protein